MLNFELNSEVKYQNSELTQYTLRKVEGVGVAI